MNGVAQPQDDLSGPDATPRRGRFLWIKWLVAAALIALLTAEAIYLWPTMSDSWKALTGIHWGWFAACVAAQMISLSGFAGVQQQLLHAGGVRVGHFRSASVIYGSTAMAVTLPAGPPLAGAITVADDGLSADGVFTHDGAPVEALPLADDSAGEPTMLELGDLRFCVIKRAGRHAIRTWDTSSPALREFDGIDHWPVDPEWRIDARFEPSPGRMVAVPDVLGFIEKEDGSGNISYTPENHGHMVATRAAQVLLTQRGHWSWLKAWGMRVAQRRGMKRGGRRSAAHRGDPAPDVA